MVIGADADTIAAIATPPGRGGVGIVRVSGPLARTVAQGCLGRVPAPRRALLTDFQDASGQAIDTGLALFFAGPHSYTGEDVLELQGHGGPVIMDLILAACVDRGCRLARPGEFTERAFLNDRLDLTQAEAVADLIDAGSAAAARSARRSLEGGFSRCVDELLTALTELRVYVEAAMDFPDEELELLEDTGIGQRLDALSSRLDTLVESARQGNLLREGVHLVIAGRPNAGKSSLLNRLVDREAAIVTAIPGTTRDVLKEQVSLDGLPLHLVDTAGLRESDDPVEQEGIRRAWAEIERADLVLLVVDATLGEGEAEADIRRRLPEKLRVITVHNKLDCLDDVPVDSSNSLYLSARTGEGISTLRELLKQQLHYDGDPEGLFTARRRHLDALDRTRQHILEARQHFHATQAPELMAEELRLAQDTLGEITGKVTSDDLLGQIFSSFCIGK
ncbi:tRNA uridine-5-carboxymethylaminomethyl(34) synthesis GTPase MnmE [Ectothiorhodospira variabilis]|uniref:tRNA uridine-5-carboxymethylaminomethyl(34) synthesis GTPase MnmE n=1 Tax=Ectothiorhodospira variabilis TaxID=505694 RepID=UPI001EFBED36|nr:tRNA uridine-5-carboxymethylaminomethyl(34) synthesis GTPase MnmE [Ectothiorhodospira variabilis]MCG5495000.1 tRNA uridine-5-carboxymethylaminomethyl(34) synthesis GTPase MnmE [Ectothiorhodospira variabilis]MCG5504513.1 tRNA uridine-5-carboxymethylaminomethyl(34) synthesis GTPase MnmE [Ectothiorhodospira variabilis]MCG5507621.1 tRNA uridine-5-carboxymethylaminomethyl(34) synthesis GTPase MnmE [Ectothiorhodospira variabilis]